MYRLSNYVVASDPFAELDGGTGPSANSRRVVFSTRTLLTARVSDSLWETLQSDPMSLGEDQLESFVAHGFLVPEGADELASVLAENEAASADDTELYVVVQPARACNKGCLYCGQKLDGGVISSEYQERLVDEVRSKLVAGAGTYRRLYVCWFGGEPLVALRAVEALTARLRALAVAQGCTYDAKIVTNGVLLTDAVARKLEHLGVSHAEVTLDGTAATHNRSRPLRSGADGWTAIVDNLSVLVARSDRKLSFGIRSNVARDNRDEVVELLGHLADLGILQAAKYVYAAPIHDWGNHARADLGSPQEDFATWEVEQFLPRLVELGHRPGLLPTRKKINCLAFKRGGELFDSDGNRFNCTEVSFVPAYESDERDRADGQVENRFAIGDLRGGPTAETLPFADFHERVRAHEYPCGTCPMLPTCGGHCPKLWSEGVRACPSTKFNIGRRLVLQELAQRLDGRGVRA